MPIVFPVSTAPVVSAKYEVVAGVDNSDDLNFMEVLASSELNFVSRFGENLHDKASGQESVPSEKVEDDDSEQLDLDSLSLGKTNSRISPTFPYPFLALGWRESQQYRLPSFEVEVDAPAGVEVTKDPVRSDDLVAGSKAEQQVLAVDPRAIRASLELPDTQALEFTAGSAVPERDNTVLSDGLTRSSQVAARVSEEAPGNPFNHNTKGDLNEVGSTRDAYAALPDGFLRTHQAEKSSVMSAKNTVEKSNEDNKNIAGVSDKRTLELEDQAAPYLASPRRESATEMQAGNSVSIPFFTISSPTEPAQSTELANPLEITKLAEIAKPAEVAISSETPKPNSAVVGLKPLKVEGGEGNLHAPQPSLGETLFEIQAAAEDARGMSRLPFQNAVQRSEIAGFELPKGVITLVEASPVLIDQKQTASTMVLQTQKDDISIEKIDEKAEVKGEANGSARLADFVPVAPRSELFMQRSTKEAGPSVQELDRTLDNGDPFKLDGLARGDRSFPLPHTLDGGITKPSHPGHLASSVAQQLVVSVHKNPQGVTEISLNPEELGKVQLSIKSNDGAIMIVIAAERPETQDLMRRHLDTLVQEFRTSGFSSVGFSFAGEGQGGQKEHPTSFDESQTTAKDDIASEQTSQTAKIKKDGLDLRL